MAPELRITTTVASVLRIFLEDHEDPKYGFQLMRLTKLPSGTLYPILARLEAAGWIEGQRELIDPVEIKRPPRRHYRLTTNGAEAARHELTILSNHFRPPATSPRILRPDGGFI